MVSIFKVDMRVKQLILSLHLDSGRLLKTIPMFLLIEKL